VSWKNLFRRGQERERRDISWVPWNVGGTGRDQAVSVDRALSLGPVYAAGRLLAGTIAGLPLQQYRQIGDRREKIPTCSLFTQPSINGTTHTWVYRAIISLCYQGNAVGLVTDRDATGYATGVEWLRPERAQVQDAALHGRGSFEQPVWLIDGHEVNPLLDIVHIPYFSLPGKVWGLSPIGAFAATVRTGTSAQEYQATWFESGGVPPGTFKNSAMTVDEADARKIKRRLTQSIREREPIVYGRDWDYTPIAIPTHEARFVETMRLNATQIAAIIGLPPELIGGETGGSMTYSSPEQRQIEFLQIYLMPWLTLIESHLSALLPRGQYVKFNVDALVRPNLLTRYQAHQIARQAGFANSDEIRAIEDEAPLPNGDGQDYTPIPLAVALARASAGPANVPAVLPDTEEDVQQDPTPADAPPTQGARSAGPRDWDGGLLDLLGDDNEEGEPNAQP
jgi:HK97 family phage portal protein